MHKVVSSHLNNFKEQHSVDLAESKAFEAFVNYAVFQSISVDAIDPNDLVYDGDDPGIDGIMFFINDSFVASKEEVQHEFSGKKRDCDVTVIFTQSKTSESWSKEHINVFQSAIIDFHSSGPQYPASEYIEERREIFDEILNFVGRINEGKPQTFCYFATTAKKATSREILSAQKALTKAVKDTGYFSNVETHLLNRDSVVDMWRAAEGSVETSVSVLGTAAFPKTKDTGEGYVATVRVNDFIENVLIDSNRRLRQRIFDENVRDFIGKDNEINGEISATILDKNKQSRFGFLNNGITIISPDVRISSFELYMRDFQIVNGCQTSNILFSARGRISDDVTVMLKIIETSNADVINDVVRSTNRQTKIEEQQFLATMDSVKAIEQYFDARGSDQEYRLYFERRKNQFISQGDVKAIRVFDIKEIARCVAAMFLDKPDVASRYPNRLTGELRADVFSADHQEEIYYVSAFSLYRLKLLLSNNKIDRRYGKVRWHVIMAIRYFICGESIPPLSSRKVDASCKKIEEFISKNDDATISKIRHICESIVDIDNISRDRIKSRPLVEEVKQKALSMRGR